VERNVTLFVPLVKHRYKIENCTHIS